MVNTRAAGSGLYVTAASGGGSYPGATMSKLPSFVDSSVSTQAGPDQSLVFADAVQRDDRLPVSDIKFVTFTGGDQEIVLVRNTGGFMRMRPTVGIGPSTPGDPKVLEEVFDGSPLDCAGPADATAGAANLRLWVAHGRKRASIKLSTHEIQHAEERADFDVTGDVIVNEEPYGLAFDETNDVLYTVTKQGGVYAEDVSTPSTPSETASIDLSGYFLPGEYLIDVACWDGVGEEVVVVLSTQRLFTLNASTLAILGQTTAVGVWGTNATFSALILTTLDKLVVHKNATGDVVAFVQAQARGYEIAPQTRPFGRVIVACDLNLGGGYAAPTFTPATPRVYNPYPTTPSGWAAYLASNPSLDKTDFSVWDFALADNGGTNYLYVCHGKMRQVRRLTVTNVLGAGFTVGAIIPCHPNYSATPASNTAERITNIAIDPANFERFIIFEYQTSIRVVVLNAGLETVNTNNAHATETINKGAAKRVPVMLLAGPLTVAWMFDLYQVKYVRKGFSFETANPVLSIEKFWTFAMDGIAPVVSLDAIYTLTFGGVIPYTRTTSADPFLSLEAGYQPSFGNDGVHADRHSNTEQIDALEDFPAGGDVSLATACGEGGFMFYTVNTVSKAVNAPDFVPQPAEYAPVVGGPLDGWSNAGAGSFYSNNAMLRVIDGETYVLQDITNFITCEWALLAWRYNAGTWDFVTAVVVPTNYTANTIPLTYAMHVTEDLAGRQFCFIGPQRSGSTADAHLLVFRIDQLSASDTMTLVEQHDLTGVYNKIGGIASSQDKLFVAVRAPADSGYTGRVVTYDFDTLTGVVDISNPTQSIDSGGNTLPTNADWTLPWVMRFLETDAGTGAGVLCLGSAGGTYVEFGFDPANGATATGTFTSTVKPNGYDGYVYWTYNESGSSQVFSTAPQPFTALTTTAQVSGHALNLSLGTTYDVRAHAFHTRGPFANRVVIGETQQFSTPGSAGPRPPKAITLPPQNIGGTTARLFGTVNPNGEDTVAVFVYSGPNGSATTAEQEIGNGFAPVNVTQDVSGLQELTSYAVQLRATNHNNQVSNGNALTFVTLDESGTPTVVSVSFPTQYITLNGANCRVRFDPNGSDCQIRVDWGTSSGTYTDSTDAVVTENDSVIDVPITGLSASTQYFVRVSILSLEGLGNYVFPTETTFTTISTANAPICQVALPTDIRDNSVVLNAYVDPNGASTSVAFTVKDSESTSGIEDQVIDATSTSASGSPVNFTATALNLIPFHKYTVVAVATNAAGSSTSRPLLFRTRGAVTQLTVTPTTSAATDVGTTSAMLRGTVAASGVPSSYYFEYWVGGGDKTFTRPGLIDFPLNYEGPDIPEPVSGLITGLTPNTTYNYRLVASSSGNASAQNGSTLTLTTLSDPSGIPPAIGSISNINVLNATIVNCDGLVDDQGEDTYWRFEASTTQAFSSIAAASAEDVVLADSGSTQVLADITGLTASTAYYFRLRMIHQDGGVTSYSAVVGPISTNGYVAPTVTTNNPGTITATTVLASADVVVPNDPGTPGVFGWIEYGLSPQAGGTGYDVQGPESNLGTTAGTYQIQLQMGGPQTPAPLLPNTLYYYRAKARKGALIVMGAEKSATTSNLPSSSDPNPIALSVKAITPYSFIMEGTLQTNGSSTDVVFQYVDASDASGWGSASVVSLPTQAIADSTYTKIIGDHTKYLGVAAHSWLWRIKATNSTGVVIYSYGPAPVVCPAAVPDTLFPTTAVVANQTSQVDKFLDGESARLRFYLRHNGKRTWVQMEYGTDPTLATHTKSRMISYRGPTFSEVATSMQAANEQGQMRYADYMTGLAENTLYYYRLRAWSVEGEHTGPIDSFTTYAVGSGFGDKFCANWAASVGTSGTTRRTARGMMGAVPANLRTGVGSLSGTTDVTWDDGFGLTYSASEDAYSIIVTPTSVECKWDAALNKTQDDTNASGNSNIAYAGRIARTGDKIWVDGSYRCIIVTATSNAGIGLGSIVTGFTTFGTASEWQGKVHRYRLSNGVYHMVIRITSGTAPTSTFAGTAITARTPSMDASMEDIRTVASALNRASGVKQYYNGTYVYAGFAIGGNGGSGGGTPPNDVVWWQTNVSGLGTIKLPVTGLRFLPKTSGTRWALESLQMGNDYAGVNGVFFRDVDFQNGTASNQQSITIPGQSGAGGIGVWGLTNPTFYPCDPTAYAGFGIKFHIRSQSPSTPRIFGGQFTPANEHFLYIDCPGEINSQDVHVEADAVGITPDGTRSYSQRSFMQVDARGDLSQSGTASPNATGPGYPPGRAHVYLRSCTASSGIAAGAVSIWGHFGHIDVSGFTHNEVAGVNTRQSLVCQEDSRKGMWLNERGYVIDQLTWTAYTSNVNNQQDSYMQARGVQVAEFGTFTFTQVNNKPLFELVDGGTQEMGLVTFTGAGVSAGALYAYNAWPAVGAVPLDRRIRYNQIGFTSTADFQNLQDGRQFTTIN